MLQKSLLFPHTADEEKNYYNEALEWSSGKAMFLSAFSTVAAICVAISSLGLIGNGIIFWYLCCTIKRARFTVYAANVAAGDFFALFRAFVTFLEALTPPFSNTRVRHIMIVMFLFGHGINSYFLAAMSTDRCLSVFSPAWYQTYRPKCSTTLVCAFLWSLAVTENMLKHFTCNPQYVFVFQMGNYPCNATTLFLHIISGVRFLPCMVIPILALLIRMKTKPQQDFPARLDITIGVVVLLNLMLGPFMEMINMILSSSQSSDFIPFYHFSLILYCLSSTVNPFVYLFVGCWKWKRGRDPFYLFLERALKEETQGRMTTQPNPLQA